MTVLTILAGMWLLLVGMTPAVAGGPTSVMLVATDTGRSASLYYSDPDYLRLSSMLDAKGAAVKDASAGLSSRHWITITWLMHDINVWRIDRIVTDGPSGPIVATYLADANGRTTATPSLDSGAVWHKATQPDQLLGLLGDLKLLEPAAPVNNEPPPAATGTAAAVGAPTTAGLPGWKWGVGGIAIGALLTFAVMLAFPKVNRRTQPDREWASEIYLEPHDGPVA